MELDWDFFFDDWLIDRVPDGFDIRVESRPDGVFINPPELTIYFGANPKYLYGTGKMLHEVIMSPAGMAIFPSFLDRPGFEFVESINFSVGFKESTDFHGNNVEQKHVGYLDSTEYMTNVQKKLYGIEEGDYSSENTPSLSLRSLTQDELDSTIMALENRYVYPEGVPPDSRIRLFCSMAPNPASGELENQIHGEKVFDITSPGAVVLSAGIYRSVVFLKFTYLSTTIQHTGYMRELLQSNDFSLFFSTIADFREGVLFEMDFSNSELNSSGIRIELYSERTVVSIGTSEGLQIMSFMNDTDFTTPHSYSIYRKDGDFVIVIDGIGVSRKKMLDYEIRFYDNTSPFLVGGSMINGTPACSGVGDIENLVVGGAVSSEVFDGLSTVGKRLAADYQDDIAADAPVQLSYGLTYSNPSEVFIPNYFGTSFNKFYITNDINQVKIIGGDTSNEAYVEGGEPIPNHSIVLPNGHTVFSVSTYTFEEGIDDGIVGTKIKALTKLTSDVHVPLKIHMKFKLPKFYDRSNTYNMSLIIRSLEKFLWYNYKKYKTGEFI